MKGFTDKTNTDQEVLLEELKMVREKGYSMDREEFQDYVICIGAPIHNHDNEVVGAISVSTPIVRATEERLAEIREKVMTAAKLLSTGGSSKSQGMSNQPEEEADVEL